MRARFGYHYKNQFDRTRCCVPFCGSTTSETRDGAYWFCADHWRVIPKRLRKRAPLPLSPERRARLTIQLIDAAVMGSHFACKAPVMSTKKGRP
jgi:hypothetical protein